MPSVKYVKMWKDGSFELVEEDRVERFLAVGFTLDEATAEKKSPAKRGKKNKITADAQVTSIKEDEEEEWDPLTGEDWADSIESVSAPEGERLSDLDSDNAKEEN
jgi:hypothetical protein